MAHRVQFEEWAEARRLISEEEVRALVDLLFRGEDASFTLHGCLPPGTSRAHRSGLGGRHTLEMDGVHTIHLVPENVRRRASRGGPIGGNRRIGDPRLAMGLVLAHELQHANQTLIKHGDGFYGKPFQTYQGRAAEREARQFADDNLDVVAGVLKIELPREGFVADATEADLDDLAECFCDLDSVHVRDIADELRADGMNNPENVRKVRERLEAMGVSIQSGSRS